MNTPHSPHAANRPITILVCALGGEGGGVLAEWLYLTAMRAGYAAQSTSIPGVAQRTGATTYYVEVHPQPLAELGGRRPIFSLNPVAGEIDLLLSSELLETARHVGNGMASPDRTLVISSTSRTLTTNEKMKLGDGRSDDAAMLSVLQRHARATELLDFNLMARQSGTVISAVLLGAVAASGALPFPRALYEETIREGGLGVAASLRGFAAAFDAITTRRQQQSLVEKVLAAAPPTDLRTIARERVVKYQDEAYGRLYDQRLARIEAAEGGRAGPVTQEMVRWLALWMAFDDIVNVAGLKLAASRMARVKREVGVKEGELLVGVYDHFKPGVPEFAALLPEGPANRLIAWDRRRMARGEEPWALPLKLGAHTIHGALALRMLMLLKGQRRRGHRFAQEQKLIEQWLTAVERGTRENPALGLALARCGRLIKGYGTTNERGKDNLLHIIEHLAIGTRPAADRARLIDSAREAALADDAARKLNETLAGAGVPLKAPRPQPIRFHRRKPTT
ncbi:MAG: 2-oxoacid:acceptor oxidoreductase family protein [Burkholderiales bacterium]|nr:2-oxoacid:acceptor oxidoreductase family protein [Burkholderiales bacterium]